MIKTIKTKFINGTLKPLENLQIPEGQIVTISINFSNFTHNHHNEVREDNEDNWENLATKSFAKDWNNKQDSIYDNWKERYHV